jgi:CBS domain-containing protein
MSPAFSTRDRAEPSRPQRTSTRREVARALVSVAGLVGAPVTNQAGQRVGTVADLVARIGSDEPHPPVSGLLLRVGSRRSFLPADAVDEVSHRSVRLRTARVDLRDFVRRPGEVMLARDILDHQLVDLDGRQVLRAADLYLARAGGDVRLVGLDVSFATLLRRLGPARWRGRPTPERVIDWAAVAPFGEVTATPPAVQLRASDAQLRRLAPSELADLLEDLSRPARLQLLERLDPETAADALEEMEPDELEALLRESPPDRAAVLVAAMEPDEAVDALRDLTFAERQNILTRMPTGQADTLTALLTYPENTAGGFMTTVLARASVHDTVGAVERIVAGFRDHRAEVDGVLVHDEAGRLVADLPLFDLIAYPDDDTVADVLAAEGHPAPLTVDVDASVTEVAEQLIRTRRASLLVVDADGTPRGRILADDVLDALRPERGRLHFPRLLS